MIKNIFSRFLPVLFCILFAYARIYYYGNTENCVAVQDTESYFLAAKMDFPSLGFFEQQRSATLPLYYRLMNPTLEHEITLMAEPYFSSEPKLAIQPGTERIISGQLYIAIFCWVALALLVSSSLHGWFAKALGSFLVLAFAFVPQTADWESILSSESLSFSLFALMIGLLLKVIPNGKPHGGAGWLWALLTLVVSALWVFTRDTNIYFIVIAAVILILAVIILWLRKAQLHAPALILAFCMIGLFIFQQQSFDTSRRWELPLLNNMAANVFPYEDRVAFFENQGMPVSEELLAQTGSAEYNGLYENKEFMNWVRTDGLSAYKKFLLDRPLWTVLQVWNNLETFFEENVQPFFYGDKTDKPHWAEPIGDLLHPMSSGVILADLILLFILFHRMLRESANVSARRWFGFCLILFLGGGLMMAIAYLGEVRSIWRHVLSGVMTLWLCLWLSLAAVLDDGETIEEIPAAVEGQTEG